MSHERPKQSGHQRTVDVFGLTKQEQASYRVSDERFRAMLNEEATTIHTVREDENNYGEWLFVTVSRAAPQGPVLMTFYGRGYHEYREQWIIDEWYWYQANPFPKVLEQKVSRAEAEEMLRERLRDIGSYITQEEPSARGKLFAWLADLTDDDGAYAELQDLEDLGGWPIDEF